MKQTASIAAVLALTLSACGPSTPEEKRADFRDQVVRYFAQINADAIEQQLEREDRLKASQDNPALLPPSGQTVSTYAFNPDGIVILDVLCDAPECQRDYKFEQTVIYTGSDVKCAFCGGIDPVTRETDTARTLVRGRQSLQQLKDAGLNAVPMFELHETGEDVPLEATVRYVRRNNVYDPRPLDVIGAPAGVDRPVGEFIGTGHFVYFGGAAELTVASAEGGAESGEISDEGAASRTGFVEAEIQPSRPIPAPVQRR